MDVKVTDYIRQAAACIGALVAIFSLASCSEPRPNTIDARVPNQFESKGRRYILSPDTTGVVLDDAVRYTADAGARTIDFRQRRLFRHTFVGTWHAFEALDGAEQREIRDVATAALKFIGAKHQRNLLGINEQHRLVLEAFLAAPH